MSLRKSILLLAFMNLSQISYAESSKSSPSTRKQTQSKSSSREKRQDPSKESDSASKDDNGKKIELGVMYTPLSDFMLQYGASGQYKVSSKLTAGAAFLMGSKTISSEQSDSTGSAQGNATLSGTAFMGYGRYFFGKTFNMLGGLAYRGASIKYQIQDSTGAAINGVLDIQSIAVPIFIGNLWVFNNGIMLSADWIGAFVPISGSSKGSLDSNISDSTTQAINDSFISTGDKLAHATSLTMALLTVGYAF